MGKDSKIEWCHHTHNGWWGCTKLESKKHGSACDGCYAAALAARYGHPVWGKHAGRRFFGEAHWRQPLAWNRAAAALGVRHRVFSGSMCDVFENRRDLDPWREKLAETIDATPWLDWLLLTKRPEHAVALSPWWGAQWPPNVWLGTTAENQFWADRRLPHLAAVPAAVRFVSDEPALGPIDLSPWLRRGLVDWVIAGGESGPKARPSDPSWFRSARDQCSEARKPFFFKQWGTWAPAPEGATRVLMVGGTPMVRGSKGANGRLLDGRTWDEFPAVGL